MSMLNEPAPTSPPGMDRPRLHRSPLERAVLTLGVLGTVVALLSAGVLAWGLDKWNNIATVSLDVAGPAPAGSPSNWLLVGTDSREGIDPDNPYAGYILGEGVPGGKRTDTIMIARVDPKVGVIHLLSLPRDLYVSYADGGEGRINAVFASENGEARLLATVEQTFGIEINHYTEINFAGFQDIVDALGGVPIWFDRPMRDAGSGLSVTNAGCHILSGADALAFSRSRHLEYFADGGWHNDGTGDLGRNSRQQYFLRRVAATAAAHLDITDIGTINRVLDAGGQNLTKDQTVSPDDLIDLARVFRSVSDEQIIGHTLPVYDFRTADGAAVLGLEREAAEPILAVFRGQEAGTTGGPDPTSSAIESVTYTVRNGSRVAGQAGAVTDALAAGGLTMNTPENADATERTTVRYAPGAEAAATAVAAFLPSDPVFEAVDGLAVVELVTGSDFTEILASPRSNATGPPAPTTTTTAPPPTVAVTGNTVGIVPEATPAGTECE